VHKWNATVSNNNTILSVPRLAAEQSTVFYTAEVSVCKQHCSIRIMGLVEIMPIGNWLAHKIKYLTGSAFMKSCHELHLQQKTHEFQT